jgi:hypothetical protein
MAVVAVVAVVAAVVGAVVVVVVVVVVVGPRARFAGGGSVVVVRLDVSLVAIAVVCSVGRGLSLLVPKHRQLSPIMRHMTIRGG